MGKECTVFVLERRKGVLGLLEDTMVATNKYK